MELITPTDCPYYLISRATLVLTSALKKNLSESGVEMVKPAYLGVFMNLWREDGLKVCELGKRSGLEPSTMTGLLDRMVRDNFVIRSSDSMDRRVQRIHLTIHGKKARSAVFGAVKRTMARAFHGISEEELAFSKKILRKILSNAQQESNS